MRVRASDSPFSLFFIFIYLSSIALSVLLSYFAVNNNVMLNPDGVCYLLSAERVMHEGLKSAMQLCGQASWPFYSVLLATIAYMSPFSLEVSAHLLNTLFDAVTVLIFVMIVRLFTTKPRIIILSLFTILCAHSFNSVRDDVIRDHGYWMCYLASLYFLLCYVKQAKPWFAFAYNISILIACLFRVEGLVFFTLLPFIMLTLPIKVKERLQRFSILYIPHLLLGIILIALSVVGDHSLQVYTGRLPMVLDKIHHSLTLITTYFQSTKNNLLQYVLPLEARRDATLMLGLLLASWYCLLTIAQLSWAYAGMLLYALVKRIKIINYSHGLVLLGYVIINLMITISFFIMHLFLSKRYLMAQSLVLILFIPFTLNYLLDNAKSSKQKWLLLVLGAWIMFSNSHLIYKGNDPHQYIVDAGRWVKAYVPVNRSFYTNDAMLMYYTERERQHYFNLMHQYLQVANLPAPTLNDFHYVAINTKMPGADKLQSLMITAHAVLERRFVNHHHDQILIYNVQLKEGQMA